MTANGEYEGFHEGLMAVPPATVTLMKCEDHSGRNVKFVSVTNTRLDTINILLDITDNPGETMEYSGMIIEG